ncbi:MAG: septum site-determining protein MinC [Pseudolabrys sp.]
MAVTSAAQAGQSTRFVCRSYMAMVLTPKPPIVEWVAEIEQKIKSAAHLFIGPPVVLDLAAVKLSQSAIAHLVAQLDERGVRVMGLENADAASTGTGVPPLVRSSRGIGASVDLAQSPSPTPAPAPAPEPRRGVATLLVDKPVRSGQTIFFPDGDVTVLGSVGSGAELIAGGSIHVYGTLRGRVMAGSNGNTRARIFCSKAEAELLAIDGHYLTADMMDKGLRDRAVQAWLDGNAVRVAALD